TLPPGGGGRAAAQTGPQTNLVLTVAAGVVNGGSLWTIPRQPFCPAFNGSCTAGYDTLRLARDMGSSIALRFAFSYFPGPVLGFQGEVAYLGLPLQDGCTVLNTTDKTPTRRPTEITLPADAQVTEVALPAESTQSESSASDKPTRCYRFPAKSTTRAE